MSLTNTTTVPASYLRKNLKDILNRAIKMKKGERFMVTRRGEPVAIIMGIAEQEKVRE